MINGVVYSIELVEGRDGKPDAVECQVAVEGGRLTSILVPRECPVAAGDFLWWNGVRLFWSPRTDETLKMPYVLAEFGWYFARSGSAGRYVPSAAREKEEERCAVARERFKVPPG